MIKKLFSVIVLTLALNFLAAAGGVGWLFQQGKLDREKIAGIKDIVFPKARQETPTTQPTEAPTTQPLMQLEELLVKASGRSATEQVEFIQHAFDAQMAILDRRQRELADLQRQVELSKQEAAKEQAGLDQKTKALDVREKQATKLATDKGFQDSLTLYNSMQAKQVKTIFMDLDDATVMNYLQAMAPRTASKIIKEFKSPEETTRIQKILERMRLASASVKEQLLMPKVVEAANNPPKVQPAKARKSPAPEKETPESFGKALEQARPKSAPKESAQESAPVETAEEPQPEAHVDQPVAEQSEVLINVLVPPTVTLIDQPPVQEDAQPAENVEEIAALPQLPALPPEPLEIATAPVPVEEAPTTEPPQPVAARPTIVAPEIVKPKTDDVPEDNGQPQRESSPTPRKTPVPIVQKEKAPTQEVSAKPEGPIVAQQPQVPFESRQIPDEAPEHEPVVAKLSIAPIEKAPEAPEQPAPVEPVPTKAPAPATQVYQPTATDHVELAPAKPPAATPTPAPVVETAPVQSEHRFAETNHDRIVSSVRSELIPGGGTMRIKLDPPQLGELQVTVHMIDGVMTASFETTSDHATRLLSHSLGQLKQALETQGISVDKLHVQQTPRDQQGESKNDDQQQRQTQHDERSTRQEEQRREMLRRLWRRLGVGHDPLDMVA